MRTVLRIKSNHLYVPYEKQDRFQKLIDLLLNENMSEEEINATMQIIGTEFPNTKNWLKWHVDNGRGPLIFPSLSKEFISGFGRDTNGQEGTGGWIKRSCATKHPNLVQGLEHLAIIGRVIENDLANEYEGFPTRYGAYTNPVERREVAKLKRKKKYEIDDARPPDTSRDAPKKIEYGVNGLDLRHFIPRREIFPFLLWRRRRQLVTTINIIFILQYSLVASNVVVVVVVVVDVVVATMRRCQCHYYALTAARAATATRSPHGHV